MSYVSCVGQLHAVSFAHDCASFRLIILCFRSARWCLESCCLEPRCFDCSNGDHLVAWYPKRTQSSEVPVDGRRQVRVTNDIAVVHEGAHNLGDGHAPLIAAARSGLDLPIGPFTQEDSEHCACWLRSAEARSSSALADAPIIGSAVLRPCASGRSYGRSIARSARPKNLRLQILSALNMGVWALLCSANPLGLSRTHGPEHALLRFAAEGFLHFSPHARFSTHNCEIFLVA